MLEERPNYLISLERNIYNSSPCEDMIKEHLGKRREEQNWKCVGSFINTNIISFFWRLSIGHFFKKIRFADSLHFPNIILFHI